MKNKRQNRIKSRQLFNRTTALFCTVCFIMIFLISAVLLAGHTEHADSTGCIRTSEPVCLCENNDAAVTFRVRGGVQAGEQKVIHSDPDNDCSLCFFIHRTAERFRQLNVAVGAEPAADPALYALAAIFLLSSLLVLSSPIMLKVKLSN